jgi:signal transduction histidine kinase
MRRERLRELIRASWIDIAWVAFVGLNLIAMHVIPDWQTIPFLIIWVSLTAIYGFRLWRLGSTLVTVTAVTLATGGLIGSQVIRGQEDVEYLVEVPLLAVMFVVMVWHARKRQAALEEREAALEEARRVSEHNLRLLDQQRRFLQDASHELRTPITVALGHTELIERAATDPMIAGDARVAVDELQRLGRLASRLLLLASSDGEDPPRVATVAVGDLVLDALDRWGHTARRWSLEVTAEATVQGDRDSLVLALDALIENAVDHTEPGGRIDLAVRHEGASAVVAVADSGSGIPAGELDRIFDRFSRTHSSQTREDGGFGLGLSIVKAIAEAHHGSVRVQSTPGQGSVFELILPESRIGVEGRSPRGRPPIPSVAGSDARRQ